MANVTTVILLTFSLIICLGSVYWFIVFNNGDQTKNTIDITQINIENENIHSFSSGKHNITFALQELRNKDYKIIKLEVPLYMDNPRFVSYDEFKPIALKKKVIILSPTETNLIMAILLDDIQYVWVPN